MDEQRNPGSGEHALRIPLLMPGEPGAPAAVVVAANPDARRATALFLRLMGEYSVLATGTLAEALAACEDFAPSLLLLYAERGRPWPEAELHAWRSRIKAPALVLVDDPDDYDCRTLREMGATDVVPIPVDPAQLMAIVGDTTAQAAGR
ncbi:response regulator transcription factor [Ramlibacter sp. G-1-2-2]|uniref:Response regulator transcription factor n=1 Tax=Ramlibacter agri TaxID=2728837 RepID=A0A848H0T5_9BURK|nr:response regulator transcription factor [Ramlibacter agri]NML43231.1 response regulator transcription factor [Ramlibacter agri]